MTAHVEWQQVDTVSPDSINAEGNYHLTRKKSHPDHEILAIQQSDKATKKKFMFAVTIMIICGSSNDFLGKLAYQSLHNAGFNELIIDYWALWMLTTGSFFICSFAIFTKDSRKSYKLLNKKSFSKICIPAFMDLFVTGGRYAALIFLPAEVISILKNGFQLFFLSLFRRFWRKKVLTKLQWIGLVITLIGLIVVSVQDILSSVSAHEDKQTILHIVGILLLILVGFLGAIRNQIEEFLLQNDEDKTQEFEADFLVGFESILSLFFMVVIGIILLCIHPFHGGYDTEMSMLVAMGSIVEYIQFDIIFILFIIAIYGKDTMQMKVAKLTSSLTRKLFQQFYPIGTWMLALITHQIYTIYGEAWNMWSWSELAGFAIVFLGTFLYIKPPKENHFCILKEDVQIIEMQENEDVALKEDFDRHQCLSGTDSDDESCDIDDKTTKV